MRLSAFCLALVTSVQALSTRSKTSASELQPHKQKKAATEAKEEQVLNPETDCEYSFGLQELEDLWDCETHETASDTDQALALLKNMERKKSVETMKAHFKTCIPKTKLDGQEIQHACVDKVADYLSKDTIDLWLEMEFGVSQECDSKMREIWAGNQSAIEQCSDSSGFNKQFSKELGTEEAETTLKTCKTFLLNCLGLDEKCSKQLSYRMINKAKKKALQQAGVLPADGEQSAPMIMMLLAKTDQETLQELRLRRIKAL